ncbi:MAG: Fe-S cluster assembly protein SufD [Chloroflexi bacterium]|nr:Fe-S cluster assembly protein SufD [Chloroflexota bacterium]MDA1219253.1 Fe-S cluster assembly protein SufD [Chloroflexota bacterium]PKB57831.1 MAG: Fe-S cluster assembly protein SufD [SAR202 cluster bacterium Casp-Chloro-G3]
MTQTTTRFPQYATDYQALASTSGEPAWLTQLREQAWTRFEHLGLPIIRRGNEKWKYTDVRPVANVAFEHPLGLEPQVDSSQLQKAAPWDASWINLVFVDGYYSPNISSQPTGGVYVGSLAEAAQSHPELVQKHLAQQASFEDDGFVALNTAFLQDGAFVHVPAGQVLSAPVHLVFVTTGQVEPRVTYPRTLLLAGTNSQVTLVESYVSLADARFFTDAVTEIVLEDGANVSHYRLLLESTEAYHVGVSRVCQSQDSTFTSASFAKGAAIGRNDFQVLLDAPGASCTLNGLYLTTGTQHMDNYINIDHAKPNGTSRLLYKGILDGKSRAVFGGNVTVRQEAQKTDAQQTDKNLLLSLDAEVDSKPSLLIYADDVKCGHGATAGHIDDDTLFYMQSRGLDVETASQILIHAFASEIIDTVELTPLREYLDRLFMEAIPTSTLRLGRES